MNSKKLKNIGEKIRGKTEQKKAEVKKIEKNISDTDCRIEQLQADLANAGEADNPLKYIEISKDIADAKATKSFWNGKLSQLNESTIDYGTLLGEYIDEESALYEDVRKEVVSLTEKAIALIESYYNDTLECRGGLIDAELPERDYSLRNYLHNINSQYYKSFIKGGGM